MCGLYYHSTASVETKEVEHLFWEPGDGLFNVDYRRPPDADYSVPTAKQRAPSGARTPNSWGQSDRLPLRQADSEESRLIHNCAIFWNSVIERGPQGQARMKARIVEIEEKIPGEDVRLAKPPAMNRVQEAVIGVLRAGDAPEFSRGVHGEEFFVIAKGRRPHIP
ncbi:hypothetical protein GCM10020369_08800 [Cryptosporangium minutisporangium]|uniref:Uncharacterized protein n=1 Tax=Cryptosporangium minutisporangium TaxID=113569 RepID=A0ABP6SS02_9ACTN